MGVSINSVPDLDHYVSLGAVIDQSSDDGQAAVINPIPVIVLDPGIAVMIAAIFM